MSLTGSAQGPTQADIAKQAKDAAAKYYGTDCIGVQLINETTETITDGRINGGRETIVTGFMADWIADIKHDYWQGSYYIECRHCKTRKG